MTDTQSGYQFGVLNAFAGVGTPQMYGINGDNGIAVVVELGDAKASILGFTSEQAVVEAIAIAQRSCSIGELVEDGAEFDLAVAILSLFASKSYVLQEEPQDDFDAEQEAILAEQQWLDAQIEEWQLSKAGLF